MYPFGSAPTGATEANKGDQFLACMALMANWERQTTERILQAKEIFLLRRGGGRGEGEGAMGIRKYVQVVVCLALTLLLK